MWFKGILAAAAIAVIAICGIQAGYMLSVIHNGTSVAQVSAPAAPAKGKIIQVDGGGM